MFLAINFTRDQDIIRVAILILINWNIGFDAKCLNRFAARCVVIGGSNLEGRVIGKWADSLDRAFTKSGFTNNGGALVILQGACNDFRSGCRIGIYQNDHWKFFIDFRYTCQRIPWFIETIHRWRGIKYLLGIWCLTLG